MDNRKLGWIAIALGVVALVVALGGRSRSMGWYNYGPQGYGPPAAAQGPGPQAQGPQQWQGPQGPQGDYGPGRGNMPRGGFGDQQGMRGPRGFGGHHFGGFFPFMLLGGLIKTALFILLIALAARWFFRRPGQSGPQGPQRSSEQDPPGPEQPPYTGGTQAL